MIICLIAELISLMLSNSIKIMSHYFPDSVRVNTNKVKFDLTNYATKNYIYIYIYIQCHYILHIFISIYLDVQLVKGYMINFNSMNKL